MHLAVTYKYSDEGEDADHLDWVKNVYISTAREVRLEVGKEFIDCILYYHSDDILTESEVREIWDRSSKPKVTVKSFRLSEVSHAIIEQLDMNTDALDMRHVELISLDKGVEKTVGTFDVSEKSDKETPWLDRSVILKIPKN